VGLLRSVGVVLHPTRMNAEAVSTLLAWADRAGLPVYGLPDEVGRLDCAAQPVAPAQLAEVSSLLVSLGGDGTMLRTMRLSHRGLTPVLGVNFGRLGFLAEVDLSDLPAALEAIDNHDFTVEPRTAVTFACGAVEAAVEDEHAHDGRLAFNDVALVREPGHGSAVVEVVVEGQSFVRYAADAVIVATPTGSTAYAFSAGGPVVSPRVEGLLVVPAAAHSAFNRALMLSSAEELLLRVLPTSGRLAVEVDGIVARTVGSGDELSFRVHAAAGKVVRLGRTTFYDRARRKLQVTGSAEAL
jgi:NAD+ kinase